MQSDSEFRADLTWTSFSPDFRASLSPEMRDNLPSMEEARFVSKRHQRAEKVGAWETMREKAKLQQSHNYRQPRIGVAFSGGGCRSLLASFGYLEALMDNDILDNVTHVAGLSGSVWLLLLMLKHWKQQPNSANRKDLQEAVHAFVDYGHKPSLLAQYGPEFIFNRKAAKEYVEQWCKLTQDTPSMLQDYAFFLLRGLNRAMYKKNADARPPAFEQLSQFVTKDVMTTAAVPFPILTMSATPSLKMADFSGKQKWMEMNPYWSGFSDFPGIAVPTATWGFEKFGSNSQFPRDTLAAIAAAAGSAMNFVTLSMLFARSGQMIKEMALAKAATLHEVVNMHRTAWIEKAGGQLESEAIDEAFEELKAMNAKSEIHWKSASSLSKALEGTETGSFKADEAKSSMASAERAIRDIEERTGLSMEACAKASAEPRKMSNDQKEFLDRFMEEMSDMAIECEDKSLEEKANCYVDGLRALSRGEFMCPWDIPSFVTTEMIDTIQDTMKGGNPGKSVADRVHQQTVMQQFLTRTLLVDGGAVCNLAIAPFLRPDRRMDMILLFDSSGRNTDGSDGFCLSEVFEHAQQSGQPFPGMAKWARHDHEDVKTAMSRFVPTVFHPDRADYEHFGGTDANPTLIIPWVIYVPLKQADPSGWSSLEDRVKQALKASILADTSPESTCQISTLDFSYNPNEIERVTSFGPEIFKHFGEDILKAIGECIMHNCSM
jgi:predicted acylesterase/phospholipase RssA